MVSKEIPLKKQQVTMAKAGETVMKAWAFAYPNDITEKQIEDLDAAITGILQHLTKKIGAGVGGPILIRKAEGGGWNAI